MVNKDVLFATWCLSDNFGDKLTPYLIEKISGKQCVYSPPESDITRFMVIGSILNWEIQNAVVWGCGIANDSDTIPQKDILAVRGYVSLQKTHIAGLSKNVCIGDPSLLLPRLYSPLTERKYKIGIFPHYVDIDVVTYRFSQSLPKDMIIINPLDSVEKIIDEINSCENIISSSLHGLIVSDAYGIATQWVKFSDRILGDGTKYIDYYSSIGHDISEGCIDLRGVNDIKIINEIQCTKKKLNIDLDKLYNSCPFKP